MTPIHTLGLLNHENDLDRVRNEEKMDVLLVNPCGMDPRYPLYMPSENLGLCYLASFLRENGHTVQIDDLNLTETWHSDSEYFEQLENYALVGISASSHMLVWETMALAKQYKEKLPSAHVTVGGHFATFQHKSLLSECKAIDSVVRGDGEQIILELADALTADHPLGDIQGLSFNTGSGEVVANQPRTALADLDHLPWPSRDTLGQIAKRGHAWATQICSSRGCYANCSFCDIRAFYGPNWRARSAEDVVAEIEHLYNEFGSTLFRFTDDEFLGTSKHGMPRAERIADLLIEKDLPIELMIDARAPSVKLELFEKLRRAGAVDCLIGIESGTDRILKLYHKGATVEKNIEAINVLKQTGMSLNLAFIMFDPRMTFAELEQNFRFLEAQDITTVDSLGSWLWPLHGTPAMKEIRELGLVINENLEGLTYSFMDPRVGLVFDAVSRLKEIGKRLDLELFRARRDAQRPIAEIARAEDAKLKLWKATFQSLLQDPTAKVYDAFETQSHQIEQDFFHG